MATTYTVRLGETIADVVMNATGTLANLDQVLADNSFEDWTPDLFPGQQIIISDAVAIDANAKRQFGFYPLCNASIQGIYAQIETIFEELAGVWILSTGRWDGNAVWKADGLWLTT